MAQFEPKSHAWIGQAGTLKVDENDEVARKLLMLIEGECEGGGPLKAAKKFGYSKQRYFQLRAAYQQSGTLGLQSSKRGPKTNYRRTEEIVQQVIRHRFLDADASAEVIAQKLRQSGSVISTRSVERIIAEYGLQKKTPPMSSRRGARKGRSSAHPQDRARNRRRSAKHRTRRKTTTRRQDQ